jgi:hypothetical protein
MALLERLLGHTLVRDHEGRLHFLPWGLFSLLTPFTRTFLLPDAEAEARVRRLMAWYLSGQFVLVLVWIATSRLLLPGSELWWALACMLPAPVLYLLGVARLARDLPTSSVDADLRSRLRLVAAGQHPVVIWLNLLLCLGVLALGLWVLGFDQTLLGRLVGALLVLLALLLIVYQLALLKARSELDRR